MTTESDITRDMAPVEAANLLARLEEGHQAASQSTHQARWPSAEYARRFQTAAEVDDVFRDVMWETTKNGMRRPGESVEQFVSRAEAEARLGGAPTAETEMPAGPIGLPSGSDPAAERSGESREEVAARLLNDPGTPEGQAYALAFADDAAARVRELRQRNPLPEPDRTPGAPHPDPFLASRGWHVNQHGIYTRRPEPQAAPDPGKELEAG